MASFDWKKNTEDSIKDSIKDRNYQGCWNILRVKSGKGKTTKGISRCYGFTKTYWWDLRRRAGERLCSLQKMDR